MSVALLLAAARWRDALASADVTAPVGLFCAAALGIAARVTDRGTWRRGEGADDEPGGRGPGPGVVDLVVVALALVPAV